MEISSNYDSMIVVTAAGLTFETAAAKACALREFRIRGVKTNIQFLENAVTHPRFLSGQTTTRFIDQSPELMHIRPRRDRATRLLKALANSIVNGPPGSSESYVRPSPFFAPVPPLAPDRQCIDSPAMTVFRDQGAEGLSRWLRASKELQITDTTFRDAHQSLLATRVRTRDLLAIAPTTAQLCSNLFSLEMGRGHF